LRRGVLTLVVFSIAGVVAGLASLGAAQPAETSSRYSMVVDNAQANRFASSEAWRTSSYSAQRLGRDYAYARPGKGDAARFRVKIPKTGRYTVFARWPADRGYNASTPIGVRTTSGMRWTRVNQQANGGRWVKLGTYRLAAGDRYNVVVSRSGRGAGFVIADAVRVVEAGATASSRSARSPDSILGPPLHSRAAVERYARSAGCTRYILEAIPHYYDLAPRAGIAPDVLVAQAIIETGCGRYGGDSRPWNMAGIKKGGNVGDEPRDFERPATAYEGVRMHVNHMAAYTNRKPIGKPHDRYYDARSAQQSRGYWISRISQLGNGIWATDPEYAGKIRRTLDNMGR
jgi:flagellum-specific peptidoglycan hydrolase FlgJ